MDKVVNGVLVINLRSLIILRGMLRENADNYEEICGFKLSSKSIIEL